MTTTDLHDALVAAVRAQLETAKAATPGPWIAADANAESDPSYSPFWTITNDAFHNPPADEDEPWLAVELHTGVEADARHIAANDPATVIRHCERDLRVLERHHGITFDTECGYDGEVWPCLDITDLAAALGVSLDG
jgi:hypothetical protein